MLHQCLVFQCMLNLSGNIVPPTAANTQVACGESRILQTSTHPFTHDMCMPSVLLFVCATLARHCPIVQLPHEFDIQAVAGGGGGIAHESRKAKFASRIMSLNWLTHKVMQLLRQFALPHSGVIPWKAATKFKKLLKLMGFKLQS